jgi:hypothetical protein
LERIGIANLGHGHADISAVPPPKEEMEDALDKPHIPILLYEVALPYAELRMGFGGKKAIVSAIGKRCALVGTPNFLDTALQPWRDKLKQMLLEDAIEARALREILSLTVSGKDRLEDVRKLYPIALSSEAIQSMLTDMRLALNKTTFKTRMVMASLCSAICALFFYEFLDAGFEFLVTGQGNRWIGFLTDLVLLVIAMTLSWASLNFSSRFVLQKRFPHFSFALTQKIGKTGYGMLASIVMLFMVSLLLAPVKPLWLTFFMH